MEILTGRIYRTLNPVQETYYWPFLVLHLRSVLLQPLFLKSGIISLQHLDPGHQLRIFPIPPIRGGFWHLLWIVVFKALDRALRTVDETAGKVEVMQEHDDHALLQLNIWLEAVLP